MARDPNAYAFSTISDWRFRDWHMGYDQGGRNTNPITGENILIGSGPARYVNIGGDLDQRVFPIGAVDNISIAQNKMVQQIRELGSRRSYVVSGYSTGSISLGRFLMSHASLLRVLTIANGDYDGEGDYDNQAGPVPFEPFDPTVRGVNEELALPIFYSNLQAEVFDRPMGLLIYMLDQRNQPYGAMYAEEAAIQGHNLSAASQAVAMSEQVSMVFDRLTPVLISEI